MSVSAWCVALNMLASGGRREQGGRFGNVIALSVDFGSSNVSFLSSDELWPLS
jgi:hypothetical protein